MIVVVIPVKQPKGVRYIDEITATKKERKTTSP
jgi:hypothetical protein